MANLSSDLVTSLGDVLPGIREGSGYQGPTGVQQVVSWPIQPPLTVDGVTYKVAAFVAPVNGCWIKEMWLSGMLLAAGGTSTIAFDNYDSSATAAGNILSTTTIDPTAVPATVNKGTKLTLTTTLADRTMDEGDVLSSTYVCGTQTTNGEGYVATAIIVVPDIL